MSKEEFVAMPPTDKEMLDWLDSKLGTYTGKVIWRWSSVGRGWRLHETAANKKFLGAVEPKDNVRDAIADAMQREFRNMLHDLMKEDK